MIDVIKLSVHKLGLSGQAELQRRLVYEPNELIPLLDDLTSYGNLSRTFWTAVFLSAKRLQDHTDRRKYGSDQKPRLARRA